MADAGKSLLGEFDRKEIQSPQIPLYSYTTMEQILDRASLINVMAIQLSHPVLWVDLIRKLGHTYVDVLIEIGPGSMLSRSIRWIDRRMTMLDTASDARIRKVVKQRQRKDPTVCP